MDTDSRYRTALADLLWRFETYLPQGIPFMMPSAEVYLQLTQQQRSEFVQQLMKELQGPPTDSGAKHG